MFGIEGNILPEILEGINYFLLML